MALYLKELALLETTTNTLVKLVNVMEGIEGSAVFGYNTENITIQTGSNRTEQVVTRHTLDIRIKDDADAATQATLTTWANNPELRFKASGYSGDTFLLWDEPVPIVFSRQYDLIGARRLTMTLDAVPGFNGASGLKKLPVYSGQNLLGIYQVISGNGTKLNGIVTSAGTTSETAGSMTFASTGGSPNQLFGTLFFPFEGIILNGSITKTAGPGVGNVSIFSLDISASTITSASTSLSSTGRYSALMTLPANVIYVRLITGGNPGELAITFNTPAIRLGYETAFTN